MSVDKLSYQTRYIRQLLLKDFGEAGQQKLLEAKVLVVGAGGLGCPALQYLTAAGVGTIGIVDDDTISLSNLHRQVLYSTQDVGKSKVEKAAEVLKKLNPDVNFIIYNERLTTENAIDIIQKFDIVIDGSDNFPTRYMINDACVLLKKPLVFGAVSQFEGQVAIFNSGEAAVNYRDLFPVPPAEGEINNCAEAGVLGVVPGIIGTMQATETIKLIAGIGTPLINRLFIYNALNNHSYDLELSHHIDSEAMIPKDINSFYNKDYGIVCATSQPEEISAEKLTDLLSRKKVTIIDVRERNELPAVSWARHIKIPLSKFTESMHEIEGNVWVFVCQTGLRSMEAVRKLPDELMAGKQIYSLKGGILQWQNYHLSNV